uniref:YfhO family protein n=1 Tax=candidate division WWE3 bacterium TaxID=2053526 RepID=A0A7C4XT86_UNCKA
MKNNRKLIYFIFLIVSALAFSKWLAVTGYEYIGGDGDFMTQVPMEQILRIQSDVIFDLHGAGQFRSFIMATLMPVSLIFYLFSVVGFSVYHSVLLYVVLFHFVSAVSMYEFLLYLGSKFNEWRDREDLRVRLAVFFAILYSLMPFFSQYYMPGHFTVLISGSVFPLLLLFMDKFFTAEKFSWKYPFYIFITFLFMASAFTNIGYFVVYFIIFAAYFGVLVILQPTRFPVYVGRGFVFLSVCALSCMWWLAGTAFFFLTSFNQQVSFSQETIGGSLRVAVTTSQIYKTLLGLANFHPAGVLYPIHIFLFILLLVPFLYFVSKKPRASILYLVFILLSVFIVTATNPPFSKIFEYLYETVPGFQLFRRPYSKIYWPYFFGILSLGYLGTISYLVLNQKLKTFAYIALGVISAVFVFEFSQGVKFIPFNVPTPYYELKTHLRNSQATRVLLLPNIKGRPPFYDKTMNSVGGVSVEPLVLEISSVSFDAENSYSFNEPMLDRMDILYASLMNSNNGTCQNLKEMGISHILLRRNIIRDLKDPVAFVEDRLDASSLLSKKKVFSNGEGVGLVSYEVNASCRTPIIAGVSPQTRVSYEKIRPSLYKLYVAFDNNASDKGLFFLNNYDRSFLLFSKSENKFIKPELYLGYANLYKFDKSQEGGEFYLVNIWQYVFYAGIVVTFLGLVATATLYKIERARVK